MTQGLAPGLRDPRHQLASPWPQTQTIWSETWRSPEHWLASFEQIAGRTSVIVRGGDFDRWDLQISRGLAGGVRLLLGVEEHGAGRQFLRWRIRPRCSPFAACIAGIFLALAMAAAFSGYSAVAILLAAAACLFAYLPWRACAAAMHAALCALDHLRGVK